MSKFFAWDKIDRGGWYLEGVANPVIYHSSAARTTGDGNKHLPNYAIHPITEEEAALSIEELSRRYPPPAGIIDMQAFKAGMTHLPPDEEKAQQDEPAEPSEDEILPP